MLLGLIPGTIARRKGLNFTAWWLFGHPFFHHRIAGNKIPALHDHITFGGLVVVSCIWSFVVGHLYGVVRRKRLDKAGH
jgi:hypothetical protein